MAESRVCAACGTRNKAKWEFCARCGESLESAVAAPPASAPARTTTVAAGDSGPALPWATIATVIAVLAAVALSLGISRNASDAPPVPPAVFAGPTLPPTTLAARQVATPDARPLGANLVEGRRLLLAGDLPGALRLLREALGEDGADPAANHLYAQALWQSDRKAEALDYYARAASLSPATTEYRADHARALVASGRSPEAVTIYEGLLRDRPQSPAWLRDLAAIHRANGDHAKALPLLSRAAEMAPNPGPAFLELGHSLDTSGQADAAGAAYRRAIQADAGSATQARNLLADLLRRTGKVDEAVEVLKTGLQERPQDAALHKGLGSLMEQTGKIQDAANEYREYVRLAPNAPDATEIQLRAERLEKTVAGGGA